MIEAGCEIGVGWALDVDFESLVLNVLVQLPLEWVKFDTCALLHDPGNALRKDAAFRALGKPARLHACRGRRLA
ncbi:MAG: hypothetical protein P8011_08520 [Acidihalobacter sp.]|uniref:hypothetical protein n=1 Tax=Acidihalobacter sp. TaxID=1872108 RepID=UPI00307F31E2